MAKAKGASQQELVRFAISALLEDPSQFIATPKSTKTEPAKAKKAKPEPVNNQPEPTLTELIAPSSNGKPAAPSPDHVWVKRGQWRLLEERQENRRVRPVHSTENATKSRLSGFLTLSQRRPGMHRLNINLPTPVYERLTEAAKAKQQTKTVIVSNALEDFFQKHDIVQPKTIWVARETGGYWRAKRNTKD